MPAMQLEPWAFEASATLPTTIWAQMVNNHFETTNLPELRGPLPIQQIARKFDASPPPIHKISRVIFWPRSEHLSINVNIAGALHKMFASTLAQRIAVNSTVVGAGNALFCTGRARSVRGSILHGRDYH